MSMMEFYDKYNLNNENFASIAGVGVKTLKKYIEGKTIRKDSILRIERAVHIAEKHNLVRPRFDYGKGIKEGMWYKNEFHRKVRDYEEHFKELIKG